MDNTRYFEADNVTSTEAIADLDQEVRLGTLLLKETPELFRVDIFHCIEHAPNAVSRLRVIYWDSFVNYRPVVTAQAFSETVNWEHLKLLVERGDALVNKRGWRKEHGWRI